MPDWLAAAVAVGLLTPLATLVMIPTVSWLLKRRLYKPPHAGRSAPDQL